MAKLNKIWTVLAASLVAVSGIVNAATVQYVANDCGTPCPQPCDLPCNPCFDACGRWCFDIDLLYWTACEDGLTYGSETEATSFGTTATGVIEGFETKKKHPHTRWDLGYRVGIGYQFPCECWDANVIWTHFTTDQHGHRDETVTSTSWFTPAWAGTPGTGIPGDELLGGNGLPSTTSFPVDEAHAHWKLRLDLLDLEIGREFCVNTCLTLRPFIGVRGAWINERYNLDYDVEPIVVLTPASVLNIRDEWHLKNEFEGAGVRGGLDTDYDLGCGVSIYGGVAASLLYGETTIKTKETLVISDAFATTTVVDAITHHQKDEDNGARAITDAEIGLRWQYCCCDRIITMQFGWEHHFFFNQNQFEKFTDFFGTDNPGTDRYPQVHHGDMSIQGLVLSARICF